MLTLPVYLNILKTAAPDDHPFIEVEDSEELGAAFANMATSVAAFVEAAIAHPEVGYKEARETLETLVHVFPTTDASSPLEAILGLLEAVYVDKEDEVQEKADQADPETVEDGAEEPAQDAPDAR